MKENFSYEEVLVEILDGQVKRLRNKEVAAVKVLWRNHLVEGAIWEGEADITATLISFLLLLVKVEVSSTYWKLNYEYCGLGLFFQVCHIFVKVHAKNEVLEKCSYVSLALICNVYICLHENCSEHV